MPINPIPATALALALPGRAAMPALTPPAMQAADAALALAAAESAAAPPARTASQPEDQPAMRVDQLALARQWHFAAPDAARLGAAWRVMVRAFGGQQAARRDQARGLHVPGSRFMAEPAPSAWSEAQAFDPPPWRFAVSAWERQRMMLSVLEQAPEPGAGPLWPRADAALRLDLILPGKGHVAIQLQPTGDGLVLLELAAGEDAANACLRALAPQLAAAVAQAGLRVARCRLGRSLGNVRGQVPGAAQVAALPFALFKAIAAVAILLSRPAPPPALA